MKKYDALYIFVGIAKEDVLEANLEKALAEVTRVGGNVLEKVSLGVDELVNRYHLVEEVFRVQILAVDERREAKIAAERAARAERQAKKDAAAAAAAPVAEEA